MPVTDTTLEREIFSECSPAEQQQRMEAAERLWNSMPDWPRWHELTDETRKWAARTYHLVMDDDDPRHKTYRCGICCDQGYLPNSDTSVWFCACPGGVQREAGYWVRRLYVKRGRQTLLVPEEQARFYAYLRQRRHGTQIRDAVNQLSDRTEQEEA